MLNTQDKLTNAMEEIIHTVKSIIQIIEYCHQEYQCVVNDGEEPQDLPELNRRYAETLSSKYLYDSTLRGKCDRLLAGFKSFQACIESEKPVDHKIEKLNNLRQSLCHVLNDEEFKPLHPLIFRLSQMSCYVQPLNKWDLEEGGYQSPISLEAIKHNAVFYTSSGYIIPIEDLLEEAETTVKHLNYQQLSTVEKQAVASFQYQHIKSKEPTYLKVLNHDYAKRLLKVATWLIVIIPEILKCQEDEDYISKLNFVSRFFANANVYLESLFMTPDRIQECMGAASMNLTTLGLIIAATSASSFGYNRLLNYLNQTIKPEPLPRQSNQPLTLQDGLSDLTPKKSEAPAIIKLMDKLEEISRESNPNYGAR